MKRIYESPDLELVRFSLSDAILGSGLEETVDTDGNIVSNDGDLIGLDGLD